MIGVYYYKYPNFGDILNETILNWLRVEYERKEFDTADIVGLGSILDKLLEQGRMGQKDKELQKNALPDIPLHVWGTGLMFDYCGVPQSTVRPLLIHALRGDLTRAQLSRSLGENVSCLLADPGLLASKIIPRGDITWDVGIIPHYVDKDNIAIKELEKHYTNSIVIDVQKEPEIVLKQISSCRTILSTSLHGIIVADSYGVPNCWCECSDKILGNGYKFHDYFSSFGCDRTPFDLKTGQLPDVDRQCRLSYQSNKELRKKQQELLHCFPFKIKKNIKSQLLDFFKKTM